MAKTSYMPTMKFVYQTSGFLPSDLLRFVYDLTTINTTCVRTTMERVFAFIDFRGLK